MVLHQIDLYPLTPPFQFSVYISFPFQIIRPLFTLDTLNLNFLLFVQKNIRFQGHASAHLIINKYLINSCSPPVQ